MKKFIYLLLAMALVFALCLPIGAIAFAEGTEEVTEEVTETPTVIVETDTTELTNKVLAIVGGTTGSTIFLVFVALIRPYITKSGKLKTVQTAYVNKVEEVTRLGKELSETKDELKSINVKEIMKDTATAIVKEAVPLIAKEIISEINKREDLSGSMFNNTEVILASLQQLAKAAMLTWKDVDGVPKLLMENPQTLIAEQRAKEVQYLKTLVAERLGVETTEIQEMLDKAV